MMKKILGGHILKKAMALVGSQEVGLCKFVKREANSIGYDIDVYAQPKSIVAQVQSVPRKDYIYMGLELAQSYITIYSETSINDISRDKAPDRVLYCGQTFQIVNADNWKKPQGYTGVLAVMIPNA